MIKNIKVHKKKPKKCEKCAQIYLLNCYLHSCDLYIKLIDK